MAWKKSPKELTDLLYEYLKDVDCQKRKMFGFPAYFKNENMFAGTFEEHMFLRLSQEDMPKLHYQNKKMFTLCMNRSIAYVNSLHPKKTK
jgi:TfoX/Sxy family transcriptional regulator of competence genes